MKRHNFVVLDGHLLNDAQPAAGATRTAGPALAATLVTDHPAYGGHHSVLFQERLALELQAFLAAAAGAALAVTVDGWLRSLDHEAVVVVDRAMFHVDEETRQRAARRLELLLPGGAASAEKSQPRGRR